ncbi:BURP domain-containing protein 16-like [Olea europaea var. sylvestris]|uniref:BURP domain-containing protein 16-like n=1 Tax=Olea europaea var. sylvestris TaxID=158386 RepID=UPI000C1D2DF9|nr:BURP domain-containing protein 16-like [Olea europaea var. sylvestris]
MATSHSLPSLLFFHLAFSLSFTSFASTQYSPSSIASDQIKFWYENVHNQMPDSVFKKLSPLTKTDRDYYKNLITKKDFSENPSFCSLAKLSCSPGLKDARRKPTNTYSNNGASPINSNAADKFSYFRISTLTEGNKFHLSDLEEKIPNRAFLPQEIASKISISRKSITKLFPKSFELSKNSMEMTLSYCNAQALKGEIKNCPKSLEEMISFAKFALGKNKLLVLASERTRRSEFLIRKIKKFDRQKVVACHEVYLPFAAYFCHSTSSTQIYAVDLIEPETRLPVSTVIAICHMDTSAWPANHVAFKILKFSPGEGEACHWISNIDLAWIAVD